MAITLKFIGALRHASGNDTINLPCSEGASILDVIDEISKEEPALRRSLLDEHLETPTPKALILVNGQEISVLKGLKTTLKDGDELVFVPVVHGG